MNIFFLDRTPTTCAQYHNDKHVVKMVIEYAQLLSTAHRVLDGQQYWDKTKNGRRIKRYKMFNKYLDTELYLAAHVRHPSAIWTRQSIHNYNWLHDLWFALCKEYEYRYNREHLTFTKLNKILLKAPKGMPRDEWSDPPPAMPDDCKIDGDSLASYHKYYREHKSGFNNFKGRDEPYFLNTTTRTQELPVSASLSTSVPDVRETVAA